MPGKQVCIVGRYREGGSSLVPRPCAVVTCSTKFANFVLQATNAQGLGTRLGREKVGGKEGGREGKEEVKKGVGGTVKEWEERRGAFFLPFSSSHDHNFPSPPPSLFSSPSPFSPLLSFLPNPHFEFSNPFPTYFPLLSDFSQPFLQPSPMKQSVSSLLTPAKLRYVLLYQMTACQNLQTSEL